VDNPFSHPPDPGTLVDITNCASAIEAELLAQFLTEGGVYAHASTLAGSTNPWELGSSVPFRIAVRREDSARADELIREFRSHKQDPVEVDWDEVDVGEPEEGVVLPAAAESTQRHYRWRWLRRVGLLAIVFAALAWSGLLAAVVFVLVCGVELAAVITGTKDWEDKPHV